MRKEGRNLCSKSRSARMSQFPSQTLLVVFHTQPRPLLARLPPDLAGLCPTSGTAASTFMKIFWTQAGLTHLVVAHPPSNRSVIVVIVTLSGCTEPLTPALTCNLITPRNDHPHWLTTNVPLTAATMGRKGPVLTLFSYRERTTFTQREGARGSRTHTQWHWEPQEGTRRLERRVGNLRTPPRGRLNFSDLRKC